jgi:hypothetical protein
MLVQESHLGGVMMFLGESHQEQNRVRRLVEESHLGGVMMILEKGHLVLVGVRIVVQ